MACCRGNLRDVRGFLRVRDTLCMSVVLFFNAVETGPPGTGQSFAGIFFSRSRDGLRFITERVKHDSALSYKGANGDSDFCPTSF